MTRSPALADLEARRLALQADLDAGKTALARNKLGQFATPPALARAILEQARALVGDRPVRFLEPALGTGAFYAALRATFPPDQVASALAFEVDPHYGKPAQALWEGTGLRLVHGDFTQAPPEPVDLLVSNPPYVRHQHLDAAAKARLRVRSEAASGVRPSGLTGLYGHFLLHAHAWMGPGALAAWLIPSEFMDTNYGQALKAYLLERVTLRHVHRFDPTHAQFDDALVSSAVVWLENTPPPAGHAVRFTYGGTLDAPAVDRLIPLDVLAQERKWTRFPRQEARDAHAGGTVGDAFRIQRGLATGDNAFFVLDEAAAAARGLPTWALRPILPSPRHVAPETLTIEADAQGMPANVPRRVLLDVRVDEDEAARRSPALGTYLAEGRAKGLPDRYLCKSRKRWFAQEDRPAPPLVCTYMGRPRGPDDRPFRFLRNHSQATVANTYLALYPTPALEARLATDPGLLDRLCGQLNALPLDALLGEGRVYGGGLHKLEPRELAKVPLAWE